MVVNQEVVNTYKTSEVLKTNHWNIDKLYQQSQYSKATAQKEQSQFQKIKSSRN